MQAFLVNMFGQQNDFVVVAVVVVVGTLLTDVQESLLVQRSVRCRYRNLFSCAVEFDVMQEGRRETFQSAGVSIDLTMLTTSHLSSGCAP